MLIKLSNLGGGQYYDDIEYLNADDYDNSLHKVKGGYVGEVEFEKAGNYDVEFSYTDALESAEHCTGP